MVSLTRLALTPAMPSCLSRLPARSGACDAAIAAALALSVTFCAAPALARQPTGAPTVTAACAHVAAGQNEQASRTLRALFEDDARREDALNPLDAVLRGDVRERAELERIFTDALARDRLASARATLTALDGIDVCALDEDLALSYHLFQWRKAREVRDLLPEMRAFEGTRPFNHFGGLHVEFPALIAPGSIYRYETPADYARTLQLYHAFPVIIDNAIGRFRQGMAQHIVEPRVIVEHMLDQIDAIIGATGGQSAFLAPIDAFPPAVSSPDRQAITLAFQTATATDVLPAYARLRAFLADEYLPAARESIGLSDMPGGAGLYRALIERETTLPLDPDAVHALGLSEVTRIETEMTAVARELGYEGPLPGFFELIRHDARFHPRSAQELAERFASVAAKVDAQLPRYFAKVPAAPLTLEPYPAYRARFEAGGSYSEGGSQDDSPAVFFYNTYDLEHRYLSGVTTLYLHEAMPGHHLQISLARENHALPAFQRLSDNNAFVEGWAVYAETLGYDMGLYEDPLQHWGTLDDEMLRAMRLVVDTGIHTRHWSRQQAVDYMLTHSGMGRSDAEAEVDRYIALPAQALSYKIGALTIQRLRRDAEARLGVRFDIRAFHAEVLGSGTLPLDMLTNKIENWIASQERDQVSSPSSAEMRASSTSNM